MNAANDIAPTAATSAIVTVWEIRGKDRVLHGHAYPGSVTLGHSAQIAPGAWIRLFGIAAAGIRYERDEVTGRMVPTPERPYSREYRIGDAAPWGGYNFDFVGIITAIGPKTVTITDGSKVKRLSLCEFDGRCWDWSLEKSNEQRAAWSD